MTTLSYDADTGRNHGLTGLISTIGARWQEYRSLRALESVPFQVMKDVGYLAPAERVHAK